MRSNPDGSARYTGPRQRTFNDDDLTDVDIRRLLGGKPALDDFMSRAAAGEFSIVPKVLQTVSHEKSPISVMSTFGVLKTHWKRSLKEHSCSQAKCLMTCTPPSTDLVRRIYCKIGRFLP